MCLVIGQRQTENIDNFGAKLQIELGDVDRKKIEFVALRHLEKRVEKKDDVQSGDSLVFEVEGPTPQQLEVKILAVEAGLFGGKGRATVSVCARKRQ